MALTQTEGVEVDRMFRLVLLTGLVLSTFVPLYLTGTFPPPSDSYVRNFERLLLALDSAYPYIEESGVDWSTLHTRYETRVAEATSDDAYAAIVDEMLSELDDRHTGVMDPSPRSHRLYFGTALALSDGVVIDQLGPTAMAAGLSRGDQIVEIDGLAIEEALFTLPPALRNGSTPAYRRAHAASNILSTLTNQLVVTVERSDGSRRAVTLVAPPATVETGGSNDSASAERAETPRIVGEQLPSGIGYIRIPTLSQGGGHDLVREFDAALDTLLDGPGLILDLRGNGGGDSRIGDRIAGRLLDERFRYGWETFRLPLPQRLWIERFPYRVRPRGITYTEPVVLLIDTFCVSSAEMLVVALVDSGRARAVGRCTAGSSGNPLVFALPHGSFARFSTGAFRRIDGQLIEDAGITPHVVVDYAIADFRSGRDPDLAAAEALLAH